MVSEHDCKWLQHKRSSVNPGLPRGQCIPRTPTNRSRQDCRLARSRSRRQKQLQKQRQRQKAEAAAGPSNIGGHSSAPREHVTAFPRLPIYNQIISASQKNPGWARFLLPPVFVTKTCLLGEPLPCNSEAEIALKPLIWHSEGLSFQVNSFFLKDCFFIDTAMASLCANL